MPSRARSLASFLTMFSSGDPTAPTQATADSDTSIATTAFVHAVANALLASPTFSGDPRGTTATPGDNDTSLATTAFVSSAIAAAAGPVDRQAFNASGTWNRPSKGTVVLIECWGAGGSGGRTNTTSASGAPHASGGGGGGYAFRWMKFVDFGPTVPVTVGVGGASKTTGSGVGNAGGDTSFGPYLVARGGGAGAYNGPGGGGGTFAGNGAGTLSDPIDYFSGGSANPNRAASLDTIMGGAGGGNNWYDATYAPGGSIGGGNGGAASLTGAAGNGVQPGGGGGATCTGTSGKGGDGRCVVTVF